MIRLSVALCLFAGLSMPVFGQSIPGDTATQIEQMQLHALPLDSPGDTKGLQGRSTRQNATEAPEQTIRTEGGTRVFVNYWRRLGEREVQWFDSAVDESGDISGITFACERGKNGWTLKIDFYGMIDNKRLARAVSEQEEVACSFEGAQDNLPINGESILENSPVGWNPVCSVHAMPRVRGAPFHLILKVGMDTVFERRFSTPVARKHLTALFNACSRMK